MWKIACMLSGAVITRLNIDDISYFIHNDWHISYIMTDRGKLKTTKGTPYIDLTGEIWGGFCESFGEIDPPRYKGTAMYERNLMYYSLHLHARVINCPKYYLSLYIIIGRCDGYNSVAK